MALARFRRDRGVDYWPGFVDALSTLVLGIIFLLTVFVVVQFFLSQEVAGKDTALARLNAQIAQLTEMLSLEKVGKTNLEDELARLQASLSGAENERDRLKAGAGAGGLQDQLGAAQGKVSELSGALDVEKRATARALAQIELLNQQIAALRRQLAALETALQAAESKEKDSQTRIADLGQRLNVALAQRVQELARYRSDFFGRLRAILGNRPDIRIVGDRFVFQSEIFFDTAQAQLRPEGREELDKLAAALVDLEKRIPSGYPLGAAGRRPHRHPPDCESPVPLQLGALRRTRNLGRAVSRQQRRVAAAPGRRRFWRIPAARSRSHRGCVPTQPPPRAEAHGAVSAGFPLAVRRARLRPTPQGTCRARAEQ